MCKLTVQMTLVHFLDISLPYLKAASNTAFVLAVYEFSAQLFKSIYHAIFITLNSFMC